MKVPKGYPAEVVDYLTTELGTDVRGDLVELTKAGFGLPESPRLWYLEYKDTIQELGLEEMRLVPGLFRAFHPPPGRKLRAMASIHVDDTRYAGDETADEIWDELRRRLKFGKHRRAVDGWQKFCGRWERQDPDSLEMEYSMEEYIKTIPFVKTRESSLNEKGKAKPTVSPVDRPTTPTSSTTATTSMGRRPTPTSATTATTSTGGRPTPTSATTATTSVEAERCRSSPASAHDRHQKLQGHDNPEGDLWELLEDKVNHHADPEEPPLSEAEKKLVSSVVGQLNWAARQGRYDLSYVASLIQQLAGHGRPEALKWVNLGVKRAQEGSRFWVRRLGCSLEEVVIISASDAAYGAMPGGSSQGGNLVMAASPATLTGVGAVCILEGNSTKIQRVVRCSMSAEISALATAYEHGDYVRAVYCELTNPFFKLDQWKLHVGKIPHVLTTDAKTGYDAIASETLPADRKIAIDVAVLRQAVLEQDVGCLVRWVPGSEMVGDGLTKWGHNKVLNRVMEQGEWALADNAAAQEIRKLAAQKKAIWRKNR